MLMSEFAYEAVIGGKQNKTWSICAEQAALRCAKSATFTQVGTVVT